MHLCDIENGQSLSGCFLLRQASLRSTAAGKPYLSGQLADKTAAVELKVWDYSGPLGEADQGKVVCIVGRVSEFRGSLQVTADRIRLAGPEDPYKLSDLVPTAPIDVNRTLAELEQMLSAMEDAGYQQVCREMLRRHRDAFVTIPAAKSVHHSFVHGLLMHTAYMMKTALFLAKLYGDLLDRDLLLAGADFVNVSGAANTARIVRKLRAEFPELPIIATGGPTDASILETIEAGANAITITPPTNGSLFAGIMEKYRDTL